GKGTVGNLVLQVLAGIEARALPWQVNAGDALAGFYVDQSPLHVHPPTFQLRLVYGAPVEAANLLEAGGNEVVAADGAVVGPLQGKGGLDREGLLRAPQPRVVDAKAEQTKFAAANHTRLGQHFLPAGQRTAAEQTEKPDATQAFDREMR